MLYEQCRSTQIYFSVDRGSFAIAISITQKKDFFGTRCRLLSFLAIHPIKLIKYESICFLGLVIWWMKRLTVDLQLDLEYQIAIERLLLSKN